MSFLNEFLISVVTFPHMEQVDLSDISEFLANRYSVRHGLGIERE